MKPTSKRRRRKGWQLLTMTPLISPWGLAFKSGLSLYLIALYCILCCVNCKIETNDQKQSGSNSLLVEAAPRALNLMSKMASMAASSTSAPLVKSARLVAYSLTCPPEASIHPCTCIYHTPAVNTDSGDEEEEEEEEVFEISSAITTPIAERSPVVTSTTSSSTSSTALPTTSPSTTSTTTTTTTTTTSTPSTTTYTSSTTISPTSGAPDEEILESMRSSWTNAALDSTTTSTTVLPVSTLDAALSTTQKPVPNINVTNTTIYENLENNLNNAPTWTPPELDRNDTNLIVEPSTTPTMKATTETAPAPSSTSAVTHPPPVTTVWPTVAHSTQLVVSHSVNAAGFSTTQAPMSTTEQPSQSPSIVPTTTSTATAPASSISITTPEPTPIDVTIGNGITTPSGVISTITSLQSTTTIGSPAVTSTTSPSTSSTAIPTTSPSTTSTTTTTTTSSPSTTVGTTSTTIRPASGSPDEEILESMSSKHQELASSWTNAAVNLTTATYTTTLPMEPTTAPPLTTQKPVPNKNVTKQANTTIYENLDNNLNNDSTITTVAPPTSSVPELDRNNTNLIVTSLTTPTMKATTETTPAPPSTSAVTHPPPMTTVSPVVSATQSTHTQQVAQPTTAANPVSMSTAEQTSQPPPSTTTTTTTTSTSTTPIYSATRSDPRPTPTTAAPTSSITPSSSTSTTTVRPTVSTASGRPSTRAGDRPISAGRAYQSTGRNTSTIGPPSSVYAPPLFQIHHQSSAGHPGRPNSGGGDVRQILTPNSSQRLRQFGSLQRGPNLNVGSGSTPTNTTSSTSTYTTTTAPRSGSHRAARDTREPRGASSAQRPPGASRRQTRFLANDGYLVEPIGQEQPKPEVVAYCRNIQNPQVLREAIRGFRGHQVNYFVIDSCKVPPFPNDLFAGIDVRWLEMSNSTVQFHNNFLHTQHRHNQLQMQR